jgi:ArsR family transcriptional regulator
MRTEAQLFKALADETRLKILWLLMEQRELCVTDFTAILDITQPKASRHLRTLYHAVLVADRRDRLCVYYRISVAPGSRERKLLLCCGRCWQVCPSSKRCARRCKNG